MPNECVMCKVLIGHAVISEPTSSLVAISKPSKYINRIGMVKNRLDFWLRKFMRPKCEKCPGIAGVCRRISDLMLTCRPPFVKICTNNFFKLNVVKWADIIFGTQDEI